MPAAPSPRKLVGPLAALVAAHFATVPARANFLTARASTVSALRSSSDEDPKSLPSGERPAPRAHMPSSLRGLRTPFSRPLEPQVASPTHWPGNQLWRELGSWQSRTQRALGRLDCSPFVGPEGRGTSALTGAPSSLPQVNSCLKVRVGILLTRQHYGRNLSLEHQDIGEPQHTWSMGSWLVGWLVGNLFFIFIF